MIEAPQNENTDYEAVYLSENFGIPFTTAVSCDSAITKPRTCLDEAQ